MADETKWSPEPWRVEDGGIWDANEAPVICDPSAFRDDLDRAAVAVNSVAGIPSEALEAGLLSRALDLVAVGFLTDDCDGSEEGCPSCDARRLLKALGRDA
jgi:hypothetical protein